MKRTVRLALLAGMIATNAWSQDSLTAPELRFYRPNYFVGGFNRATQIKFQFSLQYRLFALAPLYMTYTQKSFWDMYEWERSTPFRESNYNPGLFWETLPQSGGVLRALRLGVEHESNGKDGTYSRSWNRFIMESEIVLVEGTWRLQPRWEIPFAVSAENRDILDYLGPGELMVEYVSATVPDNNRLQLTLRKGRGWNWSRFSWHADWSMRPATVLGFAPFGVNYALFVQVWQGYGESLIDYNRSLTRVRVGIRF